MCLAAHVALWTGLGLSFAAATYVRWSMLSLCGVLLLYVAVKRQMRVSAMRESVHDDVGKHEAPPS
jgi:hypothetical protein